MTSILSSFNALSLYICCARCFLYLEDVFSSIVAVSKKNFWYEQMCFSYAPIALCIFPWHLCYFLLKFYSVIFNYVCVPACGYCAIVCWNLWSPKGSDPLELGFQAVLSHLNWMLGIKLGWSAWSVYTPNCQVISQIHIDNYFNIRISVLATLDL